MTWTKDTSDPPRIIYTPGQGAVAHPAVRRVVYDPAGSPRVLIEADYWFSEDETPEAIDAHLGVT